MFRSWFAPRKRQPQSTRQNGHVESDARMVDFRPRLESLEDRTLLSGTPTHLLLLAPPTTQVGQTAYVDVVALDASNHVAKNYLGTIHFTDPSDSTTQLPGDYTFTPYDHGSHYFAVTPGVVGTEVLTATDLATSSIAGSVSLLVNPVPVVTHYQIDVPHNIQAGVPAYVEVEAQDASNHRVTGYTGTVLFTAGLTSSGITLPANYTFQASDRGEHYFSVTFANTGSQTLIGTDTATGSTITGSVTVTVNPAPVVTHFLVLPPSYVQAGVAEPVLVFALDASNHVVTNYTGKVTLTSSDSNANVPITYTFQSGDFGLHIFMVTFATNGSQTVTATDTANSALTGIATVLVGQSWWGTRHNRFFSDFAGFFK